MLRQASVRRPVVASIPSGRGARRYVFWNVADLACFLSRDNHATGIINFTRSRDRRNAIPSTALYRAYGTSFGSSA
jgi:hypothetical protein